MNSVKTDIGRLARQWAKDGYPYHVVVDLNSSLKAFARHPQQDSKIKDKDVLLFLMSVGIQHGGEWYYWVEKNLSNPDAIDRLIDTLATGYDRPTYRGLYALQSFKQSDIAKAANNAHARLNKETLKLLSSNVYKSKVMDYLNKVKQSHDSEKEKKASEVIREITSFCKTAPDFGKAAKKNVFISYNHKDAVAVNKIKRLLKGKDVDIIIDSDSLKFGTDIRAFIESSVKDSDYTISVISQNSLMSPWVFVEALETFMHERVHEKTKFMPLLLDNKLLRDDYQVRAIKKVDGGIRKLNALIYKISNDFQLTTALDGKRKRLIDLRNNFGKVLHRLKENLSVDCTSPEKITQNIKKLCEQIKGT